MTKEEAIKEAWGEYFEYPRPNGWDSVKIKKEDIPKFDSREEYCTDIFPDDTIRKIYRPKSLRGIENNNGWIKIESEDDLPKVGKYDMSTYELWVWTNNGAYQAQDYKRWKLHYEHLAVSHYQLVPIFKPNPPIF